MILFKQLLKHKFLYAVTVIVAIALTISVYNIIEVQPNHNVLTVGFVDAAPATAGSCTRVARAFADDAKDIHVTRSTTDVYAMGSITVTKTLNDALVRDSADMLILDKDNLIMLASEGFLSPVPAPEEPSIAITVDGICYGYQLDGADLTGYLDIFIGYKGTDDKTSQYFCGAVLAQSNNPDKAMQAMARLERILFDQVSKKDT